MEKSFPITPWKYGLLVTCILIVVSEKDAHFPIPELSHFPEPDPNGNLAQHPVMRAMSQNRKINIAPKLTSFAREHKLVTMSR